MDRALLRIIKDRIGSPSGADLSTDIAAISTLIGVPVVDVSTDIASVGALIGAPAIDLTTDIAGVKTVVDGLVSDGWNVVSKNIALGLGAVPVTENLFTVTGEIEAIVFGFIETAVTSGGALTLELGVTGNTAAIIAITALAQLAINRFWVDNTTAVGIHAVPSKQLISAANILHVIRTASATAGTITYYCIWRPVSSDAAVAAV